MRDGWLSWPCWLTDSGRLNHKVVIHPASSLAQDRESSPAETSVLTAMLCRQRVGLLVMTTRRFLAEAGPWVSRISNDYTRRNGWLCRICWSRLAVAVRPRWAADLQQTTSYDCSPSHRPTASSTYNHWYKLRTASFRHWSCWKFNQSINQSINQSVKISKAPLNDAQCAVQQ